MKLQTIISLVTIAAAATALVTESSAKRKHRNKGSNRKTGRKTRNTKKGAVGKFRRQHKHQLHQQKRGKHARRGNGRSSNVTVSTTAERKYCSTDYSYIYKNQSLSAFETYELWKEVNPEAANLFQDAGMTNPNECTQVVATTMSECAGDRDHQGRTKCTQNKPNLDGCNGNGCFGPWQVGGQWWTKTAIIWGAANPGETIPDVCVNTKNACCSARLALGLIKEVCITEKGNTPNPNGATPRFCAGQWNNDAQNYLDFSKKTCSGSGPGPSPGPSPAPGPSPSPSPTPQCGTWTATCPKCSSTCEACVKDSSQWQCSS